MAQGPRTTKRENKSNHKYFIRCIGPEPRRMRLQRCGGLLAPGPQQRPLYPYKLSLTAKGPNHSNAEGEPHVYDGSKRAPCPARKQRQHNLFHSFVFHFYEHICFKNQRNYVRRHQRKSAHRDRTAHGAEAMVITNWPLAENINQLTLMEPTRSTLTAERNR